MRERVRQLNERVRERVGGPVEVHLGVNTGLAVIAPAVGGGDGDDFIVVGDSVTTAARLQQAAAPGQILVGESTYSATRRRYRYQELAPLRLKGKQGRVRAWACLGESSADGAAPSGERPLIGRAHECAAVEGGLRALREGRGSIL